MENIKWPVCKALLLHQRCFDFKTNAGRRYNVYHVLYLSLECMLTFANRYQTQRTAEDDGSVIVHQVFSHETKLLESTIQPECGRHFSHNHKCQPHGDARQKVTKVSRIPLDTMNVCTKFHSDLSNSCWDISVCTRVVVFSFHSFKPAVEASLVCWYMYMKSWYTQWWNYVII